MNNLERDVGQFIRKLCETMHEKTGEPFESIQDMITEDLSFEAIEPEAETIKTNRGTTIREDTYTLGKDKKYIERRTVCDGISYTLCELHLKNDLGQPLSTLVGFENEECVHIMCSFPGYVIEHIKRLSYSREKGNFGETINKRNPGQDLIYSREIQNTDSRHVISHRISSGGKEFNSKTESFGISRKEYIKNEYMNGKHLTYLHWNNDKNTLEVKNYRNGKEANCASYRGNEDLLQMVDGKCYDELGREMHGRDYTGIEVHHCNADYTTSELRKYFFDLACISSTGAYVSDKDFVDIFGRQAELEKQHLDVYTLLCGSTVENLKTKQQEREEKRDKAVKPER